MLEVNILNAGQARAHVAGLARILVACVDGNASVSFMRPFTQQDGERFFEFAVQQVELGQRLLLAAFLDSEPVGTVQLITATPPNQLHRADVAKLLVHPRVRSQGIASRLMKAVEEAARGAGKSLLVLDTVTGGAAERLYTRLGWSRVGVIPDYALYPDGSLCDTTIFFKKLVSAQGSGDLPGGVAGSPSPLKVESA